MKKSMSQLKFVVVALIATVLFLVITGKKADEIVETPVAELVTNVDDSAEVVTATPVAELDIPVTTVDDATVVEPTTEDKVPTPVAELVVNPSTTVDEEPVKPVEPKEPVKPVTETTTPVVVTETVATPVATHTLRRLPMTGEKNNTSAVIAGVMAAIFAVMMIAVAKNRKED